MRSASTSSYELFKKETIMKVKCKISAMKDNSFEGSFVELSDKGGITVRVPLDSLRAYSLDQVFEVEINPFHDMTTEVSQPEA